MIACGQMEYPCIVIRVLTDKDGLVKCLLGKLLEEVRSELSGVTTTDEQPPLSMNTDTIAVSTSPIPVLVNTTTTTTINPSGFAEPAVEPMAQECEISDSNSS